MVLDTALPNTQQYKVRIKVKVGKGVAPVLHLGVVAIEKGAFWSPSTTVTKFTYYSLRVFFPPALVDSLSLESEWLQVSSGFQDSPQYSGRSKQNSSLDGLCSSSDFQLFHFFTKPFEIAQITIGSIITTP